MLRLSIFILPLSIFSWPRLHACTTITIFIIELPSFPGHISKFELTHTTNTEKNKLLRRLFSSHIILLLT